MFYYIGSYLTVDCALHQDHYILLHFVSIESSRKG